MAHCHKVYGLVAPVKTTNYQIALYVEIFMKKFSLVDIGPIDCFYKVKPDLLYHILKFVDYIIEKLSWCHVGIIGYPICIPLIERINCDLNQNLKMIISHLNFSNSIDSMEGQSLILIWIHWADGEDGERQCGNVLIAFTCTPFS